MSSDESSTLLQAEEDTVEAVETVSTPTGSIIEALENETFKEAVMNTMNPKVHVQTVNLYEDAVGMMHAGVEKFISIHDFMRCVQTSMGEEAETDNTPAMVMPSNLLLFGRNKDTIEINVHWPEKDSTLVHLAGGESKYKVRMPKVIIYFKLRKEGDFWMVQSVKYFCTEKEGIDLVGMTPSFIRNLGDKDHVYPLPIPNMYDDCRMCFGQNIPPSKFGSNLKGLDYYYHVIEESSFNNDLSIRGNRVSSTPKEWLRYWQDKKAFPYSDMR